MGRRRHALRLAARVQAAAAECGVRLDVWARLTRDQRRKRLAKAGRRSRR